MSNATHTPTPWAEQEMPRGSNDVGYNDRITDTDGEGKTICEFPYGLNADSAFIVRACNAYAGLIARLRAVEELAAEWELAASESSGQTRETFAESAELLRAALAKASA